MNRRTFLGVSASAISSSLFAKPVANSAPLSVAIIGHTGRGNYGHGMDTCWLEHPDFSIVGVADANTEGLQNAQKRLGNPSAFTDYRKMLATLKPSFVAVAPRHIDQHCEMILAAIEQGVQGIYVEKPFCRNLQEAHQIITAAEKQHVKIALAHRNRYHPAIPLVKSYIEEGLLGTILEIRMRGKEDHRGGVQDLWVLGSHVLNLANVVADGLIGATANLYQGNRLATKDDARMGDEGVGVICGDRLHARFETTKGFPVYFDSIKGAGTSDANFGMQIIGTKGIIDLRIDTEPLVHYLPGNFNQPKLISEKWLPITSAGIDKPEPLAGIQSLIAGHQAALTDLKSAVEYNRQPLCNMYEGLATVQAIMAVLASYQAGGAYVRFEGL